MPSPMRFELKSLLAIRRYASFGLAIVLFAAAAGVAASTVITLRTDDDRVLVLGSGDAVSVLVSSGQSQLLIATGDDRTAFGNAYSGAMPGVRSRPDVLLLAGAGRDLNVPASTLDSFRRPTTYVVHPLVLTDLEVPELESAELPPVNPVRFRLGGRVTVVVESITIPDEADSFAWRTTIAQDGTQVTVVSASAHIPLFDWPRPPVTLIIATDADGVDLGQTDARVILGPSESLVPEQLDGSRSELGPGLLTHMVPVRPGDIATLVFTENGVEMTSEGDIHRST